MSPGNVFPGRALSDFSSFVELLEARALMHPDRLAFRVLGVETEETAALTFADIARHARTAAAILRARARPGDPVLLFYAPGVDYLIAFFGCLYAKVVAIPAYIPTNRRAWERLRNVVLSAKPALALTAGRLRARIQNFGLKFPNCPIEIVDFGVTSATKSLELVPTDIAADTVALVQYTSGSTRTPSGVVLTHRNLLHNSTLLQRAFCYGPDDHVVSWLPPFHDMGLIGSVLQGIYGGFSSTHMAPAAFLQEPVRWLRAISTYGATISGGPNFGYDLCVRRIAEESLRDLDLRSWKIAFTGAEPISFATMEHFQARFGRCGFRRSSIFPCYGLAEATLIVSGGPLGVEPRFARLDREALQNRLVLDAPEDTRDPKAVASCGQILLEEVRIVDPDDLRLAEPSAIGEIWVQSESCAPGYWGAEDQGRECFNARLRDGGPAAYLRTGDLGFLREGELYVTGRLKDVIIIRGRNHHAEDLEETATLAHPAINLGGVAAFASQQGDEETAVIVAEFPRSRMDEAPEAARAIKHRISATHNISLREVLFLKEASLPRTSSGKVARRACAADYERGKLSCTWSARQVQQEPASSDGAGDRLAQAVQRVLRQPITAAQSSRPLIQFGLDSLSATELAYDIHCAFGLAIDPFRLLDGASLDSVRALMDPSMRTQDNRRLREDRAAASNVAASQASLWSIWKRDSENTAYNVAQAIMIRPQLDAAKLQAAVDAVVERHPVLSSTFCTEQEKLTRGVSQQQIAVSLHPDGTPLAALRQEALQPFDLERGPLARVSLIQQREESLLLLAAHHIIMDFASFSALLRDLLTFYSNAAHRRQIPLPSQSATFVDYLQWQDRLIEGPEAQLLWEFWKEQLNGEIPKLALAPAPRRTMRRRVCSTHAVTVSARTTDRLRAIGQSSNATLYSATLTAFAAALGLHTDQDEFLIGSPTNCRPSPEFQNTVGYFVNTIPLRIDLTGNPTFRELLHRTRRVVTAGLQHRHFPYPYMVERLGVDELFQVVFSFHKGSASGGADITALALNQDGVDFTIGPFSVRSIALDQQAPQFDLTLTVGEVDGQLSAIFKYDADIVQRYDVEQIAALFASAIEELSEQPDKPLRALSARNWDFATLKGWPDIVGAGDDTIAGMLSSSFKETPDAIAAYFADECITYEQFDTDTRRLAQQLREIGAGPEVPVAVCFERSLELLIGVIAVIRSDSAFVPLDLDCPAPRTDFMIRDSGVKLILASTAGIDRLAGTTGVHSVVYDRDRAIQAAPFEDVEPQASGRNIAYIVYTSGTTGLPKGVAIEHRALRDYALWSLHSLLGEEATLLPMSTSISFDAVLKQMLPPLLMGRAVRIIPSDTISRPDRLLQLLKETGETAFNCTPSLWRTVLRAAEAAGKSLPPLRRLFLSGEHLDRDLVQATLARYEDLDLWNIYGPTEVTANACAAAGLQGDRRPTIGRAISGVRAYVLGECLQPVAPGMAGELYLGGSAVARGYVGRPDLTAEKFVPDPFTTEPGGRMYRTGDFVRVTTSEEVMFLKRRDRQVKVRGYRLELDEIESVAAAHPSVLDAIVATRDENGVADLVAYVVPEPGSELSNAGLRAFMLEKLPSYAVPSAFLAIDQVPRLNSGKIDMHALGRDAVSLNANENEKARTRNPVEAAVARLWGELLGVEDISPDQSFFELGGNSLQATQFVAALQEHFGGDTPIMTLFFEDPTVSGLAQALIEIAGVRDTDTDSIVRTIEEAAQSPFDDLESLDHTQGLAITDAD